MKLNVIGMIGGIIAVISVALPWWTMVVSPISANVSIYPFQVTTFAGGTSMTTQVDIWYGWVALVLVIIGALLGIAGSIEQKTKGVFFLGGALALLSIIVFAAGLQNELSNSNVIRGWPALSLFSSGSFAHLNYTTYLSYGFWLALVAAIMMFAASLIRPKPGLSQPPPPPPPTEETPSNEGPSREVTLSPSNPNSGR